MSVRDRIRAGRGPPVLWRRAAFRVLPSLPWSGSRPPASVKKGRKWREQSQFAERSKYLCSFLLSDESYPASRANKANFAGPWPAGSRASVRDRTLGRARAPVLWRSAAAPHSATATREDAPDPEPWQRGRDTTEPRDIFGISRYGNAGSVLSSPWPAVPPMVLIPDAGRCFGPGSRRAFSGQKHGRLPAWSYGWIMGLAPAERGSVPSGTHGMRGRG